MGEVPGRPLVRSGERAWRDTLDERIVCLGGYKRLVWKVRYIRVGVEKNADKPADGFVLDVEHGSWKLEPG